MSTCTTGASVAPGVDPTTWVPIDRSLYQLLSVTIPWWINIMGALWIPEEQQVSTLCALNPDDPTPPTAGDWAGAILGNGTALNTVHSFIKNKLTYLAFSHYCICNAPAPSCVGAQYADHFNQNGDGGSSFDTGNPFTVTGTVTTPGCWVWNTYTSPHTYTAELWNDVTHALIDTSVPITVPASSHAYGVWSGGTHTLNSGDNIVTSISTTGSEYYSASAFPAGTTLGPSVTQGNVRQVNTVNTYPGTPAGSGTAGIHPEICYGGSPTPPPTPSNPPQPTNLILPGADVCSTDQDICNALESIRMQIAFLVRTVNPLSYVTKFTTGTVHSGLTGQSDIVVSGLIGVEVRLTSVPPGYGTEAGQPPERWSAAKITWSDPFGVVGEQWVGMTRDIYIPPTTTLIGYYFAPGVVGEITELTAGV